MWRGGASHDIFERTANVSDVRKGESSPSSAFRWLLRGICRIALAVLDAYWIVGPIPYAPPNFHEVMDNDSDRKGASVRASEDGTGSDADFIRATNSDSPCDRGSQRLMSCHRGEAGGQ